MRCNHSQETEKNFYTNVLYKTFILLSVSYDYAATFLVGTHLTFTCLK